MVLVDFYLRVVIRYSIGFDFNSDDKAQSLLIFMSLLLKITLFTKGYLLFHNFYPQQLHQQLMVLIFITRIQHAPLGIKVSLNRLFFFPTLIFMNKICIV